MPFVDQEVKNIGQYYGAQSVLGDQFTSVRILSDLRSSSQPLIHLATHADFKKGRPDQSMIYTSDGSISLDSFKSIRRARKSNPVDLFVLSACRSALGDSDSETVSLGWLFKLVPKVQLVLFGMSTTSPRQHFSLSSIVT